MNHFGSVIWDPCRRKTFGAAAGRQAPSQLKSDDGNWSTRGMSQSIPPNHMLSHPSSSLRLCRGLQLHRTTLQGFRSPLVTVSYSHSFPRAQGEVLGNVVLLVPPSTTILAFSIVHCFCCILTAGSFRSSTETRAHLRFQARSPVHKSDSAFPRSSHPEHPSSSQLAQTLPGTTLLTAPLDCI